jgi:putative tryptophan/tyrosine transport system substrate-binding protein
MCRDRRGGNQRREGSPTFSTIFHRIHGLAVIALAPLAALDAAEIAAETVPVIGYVANENADAERLAAFKKGLTDLGYVEGTNLKIEYRYAKLDHEYDDVMAELVSRKVNVIVAANAAAAPAAAKATRTIPIVLAGVNDPVGLGVADSLQRPGRNVSGTTIYAPHLIGERLGMLKRINPSLDRAAIFMNGKTGTMRHKLNC